MRELIGKGSFGVVYNRLPFRNEDLSDIEQLNEVTKIYFEKEFIEKDFKVNEIINKYLDLDKIKEIISYIVLPKRMGYLDINFLKTNDIYHNKILMKMIPNIGITFDKGTPFKNIIKNISNFDDFKLIISKMNNLLKALKFFENNNFYHFDIKPDNIIEIDNTFKFIDLSNFRNCQDEYQYVLDSRVMMYSFWHPSCVFSRLFLDEKKGKLEYNYDDLITDLNEFYYDNSSNFDYFIDYLFKGFKISENSGFDKEDISKILNIYSKILLQKCFLNSSNFDNDTIKEIVCFITSKKLNKIFSNKSVFKESQSEFINDMLEYFNQFDIISKKKHIFLRNDRHGLAMCFIETLSYLLKNKIVFSKEQKDYLIKIYQIIELLAI